MPRFISRPFSDSGCPGASSASARSCATTRSRGSREPSGHPGSSRPGQLAALLLALLLALPAAPALAQGKFITSYRDMVFGKDLSEFQHLRKVRSQGALDFYVRYGDDRLFQGVALTEQLYGFHKNKLCLAMFSAKGPSAFNTIKAYLDANYGPPSQPKVNVKQYSYVAGDVAVEMTYDDVNKVLEVSYLYRPVMRQLMPGK